MSPLPGPICDAHHHLWALPGSRYGTPEFVADLATVPAVARSVYVECGSRYRTSGPEHLRVVGETEWVVANAASVEAIVGAADLRLGPLVAETVAAHIEAGQGSHPRHSPHGCLGSERPQRNAAVLASADANRCHVPQRRVDARRGTALFHDTAAAVYQLSART